MRLAILMGIMPLFLLSCASFNSGKNKSVGPADFERLHSNKITVKMSPVAEYTVLGKKYYYTIDQRLKSYGFAQIYKAEQGDICKNKPCNKGEPKFDIYIDYFVGLSADPIVPLKILLCAFTLGLFPGEDRYDLKMDAVAVNRQGKVIGKYHLEDRVSTYYQILLLFAGPFLDTQSVADTLENMKSNIVVQADTDFRKQQK